MDKSRPEVVRIVAFAGTGKTTTLVKLCERNPHLRFLVVMYNRAAKEAAQRAFPRANVVCATSHELAYDIRFAAKLVPNVKARFLVNHLGENQGNGNYSISTKNNTL